MSRMNTLLVVLATLASSSAFTTPLPPLAVRPMSSMSPLRMATEEAVTVDPFEAYRINTPSQPLQFKDKVVGTGDVLQEADLIQVQFTGKLMCTGQQFGEGDIQFMYNQPDRVMRGWTMGMKGMRIGGTRIVRIPPRFGFGQRDVPSIPANSDLEYEITIVEKKEGPVAEFLYKTGLGLNFRTGGMLFFIGLLAVGPQIDNFLNNAFNGQL